MKMKIWSIALATIAIGAEAKNSLSGTDFLKMADVLKLENFDAKASAFRGGAGSTGGGDENLLMLELNEIERPQLLGRAEQLRAFVKHARKGVGELEKYAAIGWTFSGGIRLTKKDLLTARKIIDDLEKERGGKSFHLDENLVNPETGEPRLAENSSDGRFTLNPRAWALLAVKYVPVSVERIRTVIATHEVLQQLPRKIESTGNFAVTRQLLKIVPSATMNMELGEYVAEDMRLEIRRGLAREATCIGRTLEGDLQIHESGKKTRKGRSMILSWFEVKNPDLCRSSQLDPKSGGLKVFPSSKLMDLAFETAFSIPSVTLFALSCQGPDSTSCGIVDFQSLPGESLEPYFEELSGEVIVNDFRSGLLTSQGRMR